MNIEDDDYCTADYGVFGHLSCGCSMCNPPLPKAYAARMKPRFDEERISRDFNLHMIDLYNRKIK